MDDKGRVRDVRCYELIKPNVVHGYDNLLISLSVIHSYFGLHMLVV